MNGIQSDTALNGARVVDLSFWFEIVTDRAVEEIWPYIEDFKVWHAQVEREETVSGERNMIDEVRLVTMKEGHGEPFYLKTVKTEAPSHYVAKFIPTKADQFSGFLHVHLDRSNQQTRMTYSDYLEVPILEGAADESIDRIRAELYEELTPHWEADFTTLNNILNNIT